MNRPELPKKAIIFKGRSIKNIETIIDRQKKPDGSDMTYTDAASWALDKFVEQEYGE